MQLFIDSADPEQIRTAMQWGFVDGVTTNPSLAAKVGRPYKEIVDEILKIVEGSVSLETIATDYEGMLKEARALAGIKENVYAKIPCTLEGFAATKQLASEGIKVNMTLCFSTNQALLAAKAGAAYISPFLGRVDDILDGGGTELLGSIRTVYDNYDFKTKILAASIRDAAHVATAAELGADIATVPFEVLQSLHKHPLTDTGLNRFLEDWKKSGLKLPVNK